MAQTNLGSTRKKHRNTQSSKLVKRSRPTLCEMSSASSSSDNSQSLLSVIVFRVRSIVVFINTALLLVSGFIFPETVDTVSSCGMGVDFNPARDIASLEGKVVLVTGGNLPL